MGCPRGLSVQEQIAWAYLAKHPGENFDWQIESDLQEALDFESTHTAHQIDEFRGRVAKEWINKAASLEGDRAPLLSHLWIPAVSCGRGFMDRW